MLPTYSPNSFFYPNLTLALVTEYARQVYTLTIVTPKKQRYSNWPFHQLPTPSSSY